MKHLTIIAAALSICFISCKNDNKKDNVETQATTDTVKTTATNTIAETPTDFTPDKTFTFNKADIHCLLYTSPSPRDRTRSRMPSSA